jgi:hypothetical protein
MFHIGDVYFTSLFVNLICKQNPDINFYYYFINGDIFFNHISNIKRIVPLEQTYNNKLINGNPPEDLLDKTILNFLIKENLQFSGYCILNVNNHDVLFINTWCISNILKHDDYDINGAINSYNRLIHVINNEFNLNIKFIYDNTVNFLDYINTEYKCIEGLDNTNFENTVFIFNYKTRSFDINTDKLNLIIRDFSISNNIILTSYDSLFDNIPNIKFIDKDYGIYPVPSCENLLQLWDIAIRCKKIILIPSGSCWTFLHKIQNFKNDQVFIFDSLCYCNKHSYSNKLNNLINLIIGENKNIVNKI